MPLDLSEHDIGEVSFELWLFDRDPAVLRDVTDDVKDSKTILMKTAVSGFTATAFVYTTSVNLETTGSISTSGASIHRPHEPATIRFWVHCGLMRPKAATYGKKPTARASSKTKLLRIFATAIISVLTQVEAEKTTDQRKLREVLGKGTGRRVFEKLAEVREVLERKGVLAEVEPKLKAAEKEMEIYRDQLLHAAVPGLTIGMMLHGAEKILDELRAATIRGASADRIKELVERLYRAMRPVTNLLKNPNLGKTSASALIKDAIFSAEIRMKRHHITLINGIDKNCPDFKVKGSKQMLVASITNLIDNSIHWLETRNPKQKYLYIGTTTDIEEGPAIVVGDNGPGFGKDDPEDLIAPFYTRRQGGMGLGLYIVSEVMRVNHGRIVFPISGDVEVPDQIHGAVVALQFLKPE